MSQMLKTKHNPKICIKCEPLDKQVNKRRYIDCLSSHTVLQCIKYNEDRSWCTTRERRSQCESVYSTSVGSCHLHKSA